MKSRREYITEKIFNLLDAISTANGNSVDFDGKYSNRVPKIDSTKTLTFNLRDIRNRHEEQMQYLDFEINIVSRNGDNNYSYINNAAMEILSALFSGITTLQSAFGNQCRWIPDEQGFEIEFTADYKQAEIVISISLLHYIGDSLFEVDITDYTAEVITEKEFITSAGKKFKTAGGKQLKVPSQ